MAAAQSLQYTLNVVVQDVEWSKVQENIAPWSSRDLRLSQKSQAREIGTLPNHKEAILINFLPGA